MSTTEARSAIDPRSLSAPANLAVRIGEDTVEVSTRAYSQPVEGVSVDEQAIQMIAEARAVSGGDPKKHRAALLALVGERPLVEA